MDYEFRVLTDVYKRQLQHLLQALEAATLLGETTEVYALQYGSGVLEMPELEKIYEDKLEPVYPCSIMTEETAPTQMCIRDRGSGSHQFCGKEAGGRFDFCQ